MNRILRSKTWALLPLALVACGGGSPADDEPTAAAEAADEAPQMTALATCTPPAASPLLGWAAVAGNGVSTTTGGGGATPVTVNTLAKLQAAVAGSAPKVVYVDGVLAPGKVSVGSNTTIVGLCGAEIHGSIDIKAVQNVIVRNIKIVGYGVGDCALDPAYDPAVGCSSGSDAVTIQKASHHIWFDHCTIADGTDSNLDVVTGSNYVTVSWTRFQYTPRPDPVGNDSTGSAGHRFSNLVGNTDSPGSNGDTTGLNVTWHHNWWADNVVERQARVRFGKNHFFNNLWSSATASYCVGAGTNAHIFMDNNVFSGVKSPHQFMSTSNQSTANIQQSGNQYVSVTGKQDVGGSGAAFNPRSFYSYTPDATSTVAAAVKAGAGPK